MLKLRYKECSYRGKVGDLLTGRHKIYEDVDVDSAKDEWVKIACDLFGQSYDDRDTNNA